VEKGIIVGQKMNILSDKDIAVYALFALEGWRKRVHTEDVALKCYGLAPSRFSWVKYPQYPDIAPARFALEAAKKPKNGAIVKGESERKRISKSIGGWMLTSNGIEWIRVNAPRIEQYLGEHIPTGDRLPADRKLKELLKSTAFSKFRDYGEQADISHAEFADSIVCTVNTRAEVLHDRLALLYSTAEQLGMEEVRNYANFCRKKFASLFGANKEENNAKAQNTD